MVASLELRLLGQVQISCGGKLVTGFISNKSQALLCYLAITGQPQTRDDLAALFWSDMPDAEAKANLRVALYNLRQLLPEHIAVDRRSAAFAPQGPCMIDVALFQDSLRQHDALEEGSITALREAAELYRGDLLQGLHPRGALLFEEWLLLQREHLRQQVMQIYYSLAAHHMRRAEYDQALQYTTRLLKLEPWHEEAHRQAMLLFALSGQRRAALAQYQTCRTILQQELGVEPEDETASLYQRIRSGEIGTDQPAAPASDAAPSLPPQPLVGRGDEFAWLMGQYAVACEGRGALTLIHGHLGTGKTALAQEALRFVGATGALLLRTHCQDFSRAMPYQPMVDLLRTVLRQAPEAFEALPPYWLSELRQLLPELSQTTADLEPPPPPNETLQRQRLFEALAALLGELVRLYGEVVLFIDDLHHADGETLDVLSYLTCRHQRPGLWYLGAYRPEGLARNHPLSRLYNQLGRESKAAELRLGNLGAAQVRQLVDGLAGLDEAAAARLAFDLFQVAGGNPLLTAQALADLVRRGILCLVRDGWWLNSHRLGSEAFTTPPEVQATILESVSQLPDQTRTVLQLGAVIGSGFELRLLSRALGVSHYEASGWVEPLLACEILREGATLRGPQQSGAPAEEPQDEVFYEFVSPLVWRAVYTSLSPRERRWLGELVTDATKPIAAARRRAAPAHQHRTVRMVALNRISRPLVCAEHVTSHD